MNSARNFGGVMMAGVAVIMASAAACVLDRNGQAPPDDGTTTTGGSGGTPVGPGPGPGGAGGIVGPGGGGAGGAGGFGGGGHGGGGSGGGGGIAVPPALDLAGLQLWHRADVGVATSGSNVTTWVDGTGNGHDAAQPTANQQPALVPDAINGHPVISFDGVDDILAIPDAPGLDPGTGSYLYVAVGRYLSASGGFNVWASKSSVALADNWRLFRVNVDSLSVYWGDDGQRYAVSAGLATSNTDYVLGWGVDAATNEVLYIVDSLQRQPITVSGTGANGSPMTIGGDSGTGGYWSNMRIAEQAFFSRGAATGFSDSEINTMIAYFTSRYGL